MQKKIAIKAIILYQKTLSKILSRWVHCRFYPTCSEYAVMAIQKYGFWKGCKKSWQRLQRCRPDNFESCIDYP
ncbi:MAG: membrane protein insertion efficiency factor YidD [Patescibacteria group bacterium]|nr:membrane protein insertion efficiency factor YidD [Patescibacteria group bacterium]